MKMDSMVSLVEITIEDSSVTRVEYYTIPEFSTIIAERKKKYIQVCIDVMNAASNLYKYLIEHDEGEIELDELCDIDVMDKFIQIQMPGRSFKNIMEEYTFDNLIKYLQTLSSNSITIKNQIDTDNNDYHVAKLIMPNIKSIVIKSFSTESIHLLGQEFQ